MDLKAIGKTLASIGLPLIGKALPHPGGAAIGAALADAVLGDAHAPVREVVKAIATDPAAMQRAVEFQSTHREAILKVLVDYETAAARTALEDRESARSAAVKGGVAPQMFWLSVALLVGCLGAEVVVLFRGLPAGVSELVVGRVLGLLDAAALMVLTYHYGASHEQARATELLARAGPIQDGASK